MSRTDEMIEGIRGVLEYPGNYDSDQVMAAALTFLGLQAERYVNLIEKNSALGLDALKNLQEELAKET